MEPNNSHSQGRGPLTDQHQRHQPTILTALMDVDEPPPVPPKDTPLRSRMDIDQFSTARTSGSKRKRESHDETAHDFLNGRLEIQDADVHTPKRSRSRLGNSDADASEDATTGKKRSVRRKQGSHNLSGLSNRHAVALHQSLASPSRDSRFREGSLTDKPSDKPPSIFIRQMGLGSSNPENVDQLMADYHDGVPGVANTQPPGSTMPGVEDRRGENAGIFRFGRSIAATFNPVSLWNRMWPESKEELGRQAVQETERRVMQKAEAETRYAQMKRDGQFGFSVASSSIETATPRDSGVAVDGLGTSHAHSRAGSYGSQLAHMQDDMTSQSGSEVPEAGHKTLRGIRSRLHLKRPSLSNIKSELKRVKSDFNLTAAANRESSSSLSPTKAEFPESRLQRSHSRYDLKKQTKLSKKVSDLEVKLQKARQELQEALVSASPMPKLGNRYERFTPTGTLKRPKFVPGTLPTLPSERILFPEHLTFGKADEPSEPRKALELTGKDKALERSEEDSETVRPARTRPYPLRASSLFDLDNNDTTSVNDKASENQFNNSTIATREDIIVTQPAEPTTMDPNSLTDQPDNEVPQQADEPKYDSLDAKLKALDSSHKASKKLSKPKKRAAATSKADKEYKPGQDDDDDEEWEATPKKKRKSGDKLNSSPANKRTSKIPKPKTEVKAATKITASPRAKKKSSKTRLNEDTVEDAKGGAPDELAEMAPARTSMDSQGILLEPVYEEEEETTAVLIKDVPSKPTAMSTPARYGRNAVRSRSNSPYKRAAMQVPPGVEEKIITRAAEVAQHGRRGRSNSPAPVSFDTPGNQSVVQKETTSDEVSNSKKESFQWPDDVF